MRALSIFIATIALLTTASTAQAGPGSTDTRQITAEQVARATGNFILADGRRAHIFASNERLYVRVGQDARKEIVLDGPNRFVSRDGSIVVRFEPGSNDDRIVLEHDGGITWQDSIRLAASERPGRGTAD